MAIDLKYGRVTLEHGTVGEDEPVVVFRAQDALLPTLLDLYVFLCRNAGSPERHVAGVHAAQQTVIEWQTDHFNQVPQSAGTGEA
jgi:hypothetical protein